MAQGRTLAEKEHCILNGKIAGTIGSYSVRYMCMGNLLYRGQGTRRRSINKQASLYLTGHHPRARHIHTSSHKQSLLNWQKALTQHITPHMQDILDCEPNSFTLIILISRYIPEICRPRARSDRLLSSFSLSSAVDDHAQCCKLLDVFHMRGLAWLLARDKSQRRTRSDM